MIWRLKKAFFIQIVFFLMSVPVCFAYKATVHKKITEYGVKQSIGIKSALDQVGLDDTIPLSGKKPYEWIEYGSTWEDSIQIFTPSVYSLTFYKLLYCHFYNPLTNLGYTDGIELDLSLIGRAVDPSNEWAYQYARMLFYSALTGDSTFLDGITMNDQIGNDSPIVGTVKMGLEEREQFFAWTLQALGHTIHLIQDASVPAHTRNDLHVYEPYEKWTKNKSAELNYEGITSDPNIFLNSSDSIIAPYDFIDTDQLDDTSEVPLSGAFQGLAEYSHANFLSNHTIFGFDLPEAPSWDENPPDYSDPKYLFEEENINLRDRKFVYMKSPYSDEVDHFVRCGILHLMPSPLEPSKAYYEVWYTVDDSRVNDDYAAQLIPRAVGYSAAFLDYFFRGQLEVGDVEVVNGIPLINGSGTVVWPDAISSIKADVQNVSTLGEQAELVDTGTLIGIARYVLTGGENYSVSQEVTLSQTEIDALNSDLPPEITFDFSGDAIPVGSSGLSLQVVFKGTLGNELDNGIAVGRSDVSAGTMEVSPPDEYVYGIVDGSISPHQFNSIRAKVMNTTTSLDELGNLVIAELQDGQLYAVARYREIPGYLEDLSNYPADEAALQALMENEPFVTSQSAIIAIDPLVNPISSAAPTSMTFDFSTEPIPAGVTDLTLHIVFSGVIGDGEELTMAAGTVDLNEPQYLTFANDTDYFLLNGVPVKTEDIIDDPDVDLYGQIYPHDFTEELGFSATEQIAPFVVTFASLPPARYSQIIILVDNPSGYYVTDRITATWDDITWLDGTWSYQFPGTINREESPGVWQWTPVYTVRDITQHQRMYYMNYYPYFVYINSLPAPPENALGPYPATINLPD